MKISKTELVNISYSDLTDQLCWKLLMDLQQGKIGLNDFREASRTINHIGTGLDFIINKNDRL